MNDILDNEQLATPAEDGSLPSEPAKPGPEHRIAPPPNSPVRRVYRSRRDRKIAGVCGGIAEYFRIDPTIVRLGAIVFAVTGAGILAYLAAWLVMPEQPEALGAPDRGSVTT